METCPVRQTILFLSDQIGPKGLSDPRGQRISEQILALAEEIAEGAAGDQHLAAIEALIEEYNYTNSPETTRSAGKKVKALLADGRPLNPGWALIYAVIAASGAGLLAVMQHRAAKKSSG